MHLELYIYIFFEIIDFSYIVICSLLECNFLHDRMHCDMSGGRNSVTGEASQGLCRGFELRYGDEAKHSTRKTSRKETQALRDGNSQEVGKKEKE